MLSFLDFKEKLGILTPNYTTPYIVSVIDLQKSGPIVFEIPPGLMAGMILDVSQRVLADLSVVGPDHGPGGKYLILPPSYAGPKPAGYAVLQSDTFGGYALIRSNLASHNDADVAKAIVYGKKMQVYPLAQAANPAQTIFTDAKDVTFDSTIRYDSSFFSAPRPDRANRALAATRPGDNRPAQVAWHRKGQAIQPGPANHEIARRSGTRGRSLPGRPVRQRLDDLLRGQTMAARRPMPTPTPIRAICVAWSIPTAMSASNVWAPASST